MQQVTVIPFSIDDYDQVYQLWCACNGVGLSAADSRKAIQVYLARNPGMSFTAHNRTKLLGAILAGHDGRRGYIHHLAVDPMYRKQGIGKRLVSAALEGLHQKKIAKCHLFIFSDNEEGRIFWKKIGWNFRHDINLISKNL